MNLFLNRNVIQIPSSIPFPLYKAQQAGTIMCWATAARSLAWDSIHLLYNCVYGLLNKRSPIKPDLLHYQPHLVHLKGGHSPYLFPPKSFQVFLFLHPNHSQRFELTTFVFSNYFHSSAWRTDLENKHKLIPNTLIISNEHLSYSISEEPMCYTARKAHEWRARRWKRTAAGAASASREAGRDPGSRCGRSSGGQVPPCAGSLLSLLSLRSPLSLRALPGSRGGAALCWPQPPPHGPGPRQAQPLPARSSKGKTCARRTTLEPSLTNVYCGFGFLRPLWRNPALLLFTKCMDMKLMEYSLFIEKSVPVFSIAPVCKTTLEAGVDGNRLDT